MELRIREVDKRGGSLVAAAAGEAERRASEAKGPSSQREEGWE